MASSRPSLTLRSTQSQFGFTPLDSFLIQTVILGALGCSAYILRLFCISGEFVWLRDPAAPSMSEIILTLTFVAFHGAGLFVSVGLWALMRSGSARWCILLANLGLHSWVPLAVIG